MKFCEDAIRRSWIPWDIRGLLHDLCWHMDKTPVSYYVQRAQQIMMAEKTPPRPKKVHWVKPWTERIKEASK